MTLRTIKLTKGASRWDLMLAFFDPHPAGMHGLRRADFTMSNGLSFSLELTGLEHEPYPSLEPWILTGELAGSLPKGYAVSEPGAYSDHLALQWNGFKHAGMVDLYVVSPCCLDEIYISAATGVRVGYCAKCNKPVTWISDRTGHELWLGDSEVGSGEKYLTRVDDAIHAPLAEYTLLQAGPGPDQHD